ncbi:prolipoprotein diacylglyceryl transferase family protein [Foetidibacter luteolus]|uniref:prolipoprotein diacylglyceryl transferase family protein n=1 Tax=Foetidibacter luteolus TaxID=2608880 RepID=UPI001F1AA3B2|nr:prolipoprotein diacylglyceryl transferase family protein [Foetidibacter luteolus]
MHFPVEITVGSVKILLHSIAEPLAFFIGFRYFLYLRKKQGDAINSQNRLWVLIGAVFGAVLGSRLIGGLENVPQMMAAKNKLFYFYQNKTVLGGFLGGLLGVELAKKLIGEKTSSGDLFAYPMILALIIGRIGCFSMGIYEETYGLPTSLPWGMHLGDNQPRHPVCLYETLYLLLLWAALVQLEKRYILQNGARFKLFLISYCMFRFLLDFIKPHYSFGIGLSTIQLTALAGLVYYYRYIIHPGLLVQERKKAITGPAAEYPPSPEGEFYEPGSRL